MGFGVSDGWFWVSSSEFSGFTLSLRPVALIFLRQIFALSASGVQGRVNGLGSGVRAQDVGLELGVWDLNPKQFGVHG